MIKNEDRFITLKEGILYKIDLNNFKSKWKTLYKHTTLLLGLSFERDLETIS